MPHAAANRQPDRRRAHRLTLRGARLRGHNLEARLIDFSARGLGLETHAALRIGATYRFRLFGGDGRPVEAVVRWCRLRTTRRTSATEVLPVYRAGLTLTSPAESI